MSSIDRRSSSASPENEPASKQEAVEQAAGVQRHKDGSVRRITPGVRSLRDFFDPDQASRPLTRGDIVNALAAIFYYERESRWHRRLWRWLHELPQVKSVADELANAHARGLDAAKDQVAEQVAHAQQSVAAFRAGSKAEAEGA